MRVAVFLLLAVAACDAYDRDLGPTPYLCGPDEPRCPTGYTCMEDISTGDEVCVGDSDSIPNNFECADDSAIEPNDMLSEGTMTPVDSATSFAICPAGDKDTFAINAAGGNLEVIVTFQLAGATLVASILNQGGVPIATATEVTGMPTAIRAAAQNLPNGLYYARVAGPNTGDLAINNYKITINVN